MTTKSAVLQRLLSLLAISSCRAKHEHEFLFPPNDEYDFKILDPNTVYGSPYGGYARATRSRLAKLPLILPTTIGLSVDETLHMTVSDGDGRRYVCRTYLDDDLHKSSTHNSMFDRVDFQQPALVPQQLLEHDDNDASAATRALGHPDLKHEKKTTKDDIISIMQYLQGVCTQMHQGWWSYEWCFGKHVRQFHIQLGESDNIIKMESITGLGEFIRRDIELVEETVERRARLVSMKRSAAMGDPNYEEFIRNEAIDLLMDPLMGGREALGQVVDHHEFGDVCQSTGLPRTTKVEYRCCSPDHMQTMKPFVIYNGMPIPSDIAAIAQLEEPSTCKYHLLICTPVLCDGLAENYKSGPDANEADATSKTWKTPPVNLRPKNDNESIQDIIDRTLEGACMYYDNANHWWTYEMCHGSHVRQYHELELMDPITGLSSRQLQVEYTLGRYMEDAWESIEPHDEIQNVVNVTEFDVTASATVTTSKATNRGNGAYFYHEYTNGEVCSDNDPDVKDKGGKPRAVTLRYYCGPKFDIPMVNEDSTCHYIMHITIPDLCEHPLFRKPEEKKRIIKCLPMSDL